MNRTLTSAALAVLLLSPGLQAQWSPEADVPSPPFDGGYAFTLGGKVYVGSGDALHVYDPASGAWSPRADFPGIGDDRGWATSFVIGNIAYVGLGITTGNIFRSDLYAYDPVGNSWTGKADFPGTARGGASSFVVNGKAYVCGGTSTGPTFSEVYCYDPVANSWAQVSTLPTGTRGFTTAFAIGDHGYVYGGYYGFGNETPQLHRYDPVGNSWEQMSSFPGGGRQSAVAVVIDGRAIVGMGHAGFMTGYDDLYAYDPVGNAWSPVPGDFSGGARICPVAAAVNNTLYLGTGYDMSFSPNNDWWSKSVQVGMPEIGELSLHMDLFPVPTEDALRIRFDAPANGRITVTNIAGAMLMDQALRGASGSIDLSALAPGVYTVRYAGSDGRTAQAKAIKR